jgi:membrane associated rhomboid family serine protease
VILIVLACALAGAGEQLQYERHGAVWRFATASLVHWSVDQLIWDTLAFAALASIAATRWPARFHITLIASALAIPIVVHVALPSVMTYRGLSGIDSALYALVAARLLMIPSPPAPLPAARGEGGPFGSAQGKLRPGEGRPHRIVIVTCAIGFAAKVTFECLTHSTLFVRDLAPGVAPIPLAHVAGAAIGVLSSMPWSKRRWSSLRWSWRFGPPRRSRSIETESAPPLPASRRITQTAR